jgi:hypothetical protein
MVIGTNGHGTMNVSTVAGTAGPNASIGYNSGAVGVANVERRLAVRGAEFSPSARLVDGHPGGNGTLNVGDGGRVSVGTTRPQSEWPHASAGRRSVGAECRRIDSCDETTRSLSAVRKTMTGWRSVSTEPPQFFNRRDWPATEGRSSRYDEHGQQPSARLAAGRSRSRTVVTSMSRSGGSVIVGSNT